VPASPLRLLLAVLALLGLSGCAARLQAPAPPQEPRTVWLLEHGRHSTLLLTAGDAALHRYAYADWAWYVEGERGAAPAVDALLRRSQAALGHARFPPGSGPGDVGVGVQRSLGFEVEAEAVDTLLQGLNALFEGAAAEPQFSSSNNLHFVPHPQPYRFGYNSNHMVADWLRALGVEVRGNPAVGQWRMAGAAGDGSAGLVR
jgi:hypothetical protein